MNFTIFNRNQALNYAKTQHDNTALVISINGSSEPPAPIMPDKTNNIKAVLHIQFNDVDKDTHNAMTELHAAHIAKFMSQYTADTLIVHCSAGQSRSAGVCAAIMKVLTGTDTPVFNDPKYTPNMRCYRLTMNALMDIKSKESED